MTERRSSPGVIAGWPVAIETFRLGDTTVELFSVADLERLLDRERLLRDDAFEPPYWALVWSGARLLAEWLTEIEGLAGARVLDAGCGLGLVGLAAAKLGARVTAIDRSRDALAFAAASSRRLACGIEFLEGDLCHGLGGRRFDFVLAAEILYERAGFPRLAEALRSALVPGGSLLVADGFRVDTRSFYEELGRRGLRCTRSDDRLVDEEGSRVRVRLARYDYPAPSDSR